MSASDRVKLGDSNLIVSTCCLGTMTFGNQNTEQEAHEQLGHAFNAGINFLDTAEMYPVPTSKEQQGRTDKFIGTWLKAKKRDELVLASKVSGYSERLTYLRKSGEPTKVTRQQIIESVDDSLSRLQTDYLDLLQIHWPERNVPLWGTWTYNPALDRADDVPFEEQLRALEEVIKAGKVRYIGVSNETPYGVSEFVHASALSGLPKISTIQNVYNLLTRQPFEVHLAETCRKHNVALMAYSPLAGGALSGKYIGVDSVPNARFTLFPGYMERYNRSAAKLAVAEYAELASKHGLTMTQLALAWCRSRWFVSSTIIGATSMDQLKENLQAFELTLSDEVLTGIDEIFRKYKDPAMV